MMVLLLHCEPADLLQHMLQHVYLVQLKQQLLYFQIGPRLLCVESQTELTDLPFLP